MTRRALTYEDIYRIKSVSGSQISPDGSRVAFVVSTADRDADENRSQIWIAPVDGVEPVQLTFGNNDSGPRWSPDGQQLAFIRTAGEGQPPQLFVLPTTGGEARQLGNFGLGVTNVWWSPDSTRVLVTVITDLTGEAIDDADKKRKANAPVVVQRGLFKSDGIGLVPNIRIHLNLIDVASGDVEQLTKGDLSVSAAAWSPDGKRIAFDALGPDSDLAGQSYIYVIGVDGGEPELVVEWEGTAGVPCWSPSGDNIAFVGNERTGSFHNRLYSVPATGGTPRLVDPEFDRNLLTGGPAYPGAPPIWTSQDEIIFCARDRGCTNAYSVASGGGPATKIAGNEERVVDGVTIAPEAGRIAYVLSAPDIPADVFVAGTDGTDERRLTSVNGELLDEVELHLPEERTFTAPDGLEIHGWVIRGDGEGKQPLLLDIHGGPHNSWSPAFDAIHLWHEILAAQGWTTLILNPRGSDGYGEEFYRAAIGGWGLGDENDFLSSIDELVDEGTVDPDRLAVTGYSYGGYMTNWLSARSDRFKAAVTGGCVTNEVSMHGTSDFGPLLATFEMEQELVEARDRYVELSPLSYVENVTAPVLILHGENDDRCPIGQAEEWFSVLRRLGKTVEMVRYPGASHLFIGWGLPSHRVDYIRRLVDWVTRYTEA